MKLLIILYQHVILYVHYFILQYMSQSIHNMYISLLIYWMYPEVAVAEGGTHRKSKGSIFKLFCPTMDE